MNAALSEMAFEFCIKQIVEFLLSPNNAKVNGLEIQNYNKVKRQ